MFKHLYLAVGAASFSLDTVDAKFNFGGCAANDNMPTFDQEKFAGQWYEVVRDPGNLYTFGTDCTTMEYTQPIGTERRMDGYFRSVSWVLLGFYIEVTGYFLRCDDASTEWTCQ